MAEIFLSYSREDASVARLYAAGLEREGFGVWWDATLRTGDSYDRVTEKALAEARAVVVLWSGKSVESRWVRSEATEADRRGTLLPVMIESCKRPIMFELTHTAELAHWRGEESDPAWRAFVADVHRFIGLGKAEQGSPAMPAKFIGQRGPSGWRWAVLALALLVAGVIAFALMPQAEHASASLQPEKNFVAESTPARLRIAVLPFDNLSAEAEAFFTEALHDEILTALTNGAPDLEVISRTTMKTYSDARKPITQIASELGATHVLEGSVRREGEDVRLTLQLIDARADRHLWARNFDRKLVSAMTLQSEVAGEVASQLSVELTGPGASASAPTRDAVAYDLYLKARLILSTLGPGSPESAGRDLSAYLDQAIERDPSFGQAYALRAYVVAQSLSRLPDPRVGLEQAREDLLAARALLPGDPSLLLVEAQLQYAEDSGDLGRARTTLAAAEAAGLSESADVLMFKAQLLGRDRPEERLPLVRRATELDPRNIAHLGQYQILLQGVRRPREALEVRTRMMASLDDPFLPIGRERLLFDYTGRTKGLRDMLDRNGPRLPENLRIGLELVTLRFERQFEAFRTMAAAAPPGLVQIRVLGGGTFWYIESLRGQAALLTNDAALGRQAGKELLAIDLDNLLPIPGFDPQTVRALRSALDAEGHLLRGDKGSALAAARTARESASGEASSPLVVRQILISAATTLAWSGEREEAVELLEELASQPFGLAPAEITREPLFTVPLAGNPRFRALTARLEAQMEELDLR